MPSLWAYNYNLEFELADQPVIHPHFQGMAPWFYLNRSSILFLPMTTRQDAVLTYEMPHPSLLERHKHHLGYLPHFVLLNPGKQETNSLFPDLEACELKFPPGDYHLAPWGWSPLAEKTSGTVLSSEGPGWDIGIVHSIHSKEFSHQIRKNLPDSSAKIPDLFINGEISPDELAGILSQFYHEQSTFLIKHCFGTSGKMIDACNSDEFSVRKLDKWCRWSAEAGLLVEKRLDKKREYSIQGEIDKDGRHRVLVMTELLSGRNFSYNGNIMSREIESRKTDRIQETKQIFRELFTSGYRGPVGIDYIETADGNNKLVEINPRLTMGRIAHEWNKALNTYPVGMFFSFFAKNPFLKGPDQLFQFCSLLEKRDDCSIFLVNLVQSPKNADSLLTFLIGANNKSQVVSIQNTIKHSLLQKDKL